MLTRTFMLRAAAGAVFAALDTTGPAGAADCDTLQEAGAVICEVNAIRADRELAAVTKDRRLQRAATGLARDMVQRGYFSHVTPEGAKLSDRLRATGYISGRVSWRVGETLAWGRGPMAEPGAIVAGWMRSPSHRRILLGRYLEIGVGVADGIPSGGTGTTYTADFGVLGDRGGP